MVAAILHWVSAPGVTSVTYTPVARILALAPRLVTQALLGVAQVVGVAQDAIGAQRNVHDP